MFVRKAIRKYKGKTYTNHLLVESVRTPKGPRQRIVCSLGDLRPRPRSEWLKLAHKVEDALVGQEDLLDQRDAEVRQIVARVRARQARAATRADPTTEAASPEDDDDLITVRTSKVNTEHHREGGSVHVGHQFWKRLELDTILARVGLLERARRLTCAMTLNRLIHPSSEHAMPDWMRSTALEDILEVNFSGLGESSLYRNLDKLHPKRGEIESALVERERTLFNLEGTILLYDLTSTYFEGQAMANGLASRGYSRDKRPDCKQVLVGLVIGREGFPLAHEVFEGRRQDRSTLGEMLDRLGERVGLSPGQTVVVDRGMAHEENLEEIRFRDLHYLVASRQPERNQWLAAYDEVEGFEEVRRSPSPRNPYQKKTKVWVKKASGEGETHVLCISEERIEKDRAIRKKHEQRLLRDLEKLAKRISLGQLVNEKPIWEAIGRLKERYPRVARYYRIEYDPQLKQLRYEENEEKKQKAEKLDGAYLLKTDRPDFTADEAWRIYSLLTRVESAFRAMKSPLAERPIFHQLQRRVETHIFLCVLAYHLLVAIENTLLGQGMHTSWATVRETLKTHQVATVVLPTDSGSVLRIRKGSRPEPQHVELYDLLGVPHEIMTPAKTWTDAAM